MTDQTPDLAALEALAEAAKLGPLEIRLGKHRDLIEVSGPFVIKLGNLDQAKPEQAEFIAQAPAAVLWLIREVERLTRWKAEALPVIGGLQELGSALGLPLGERITGPAALEAVERLTARAEAAEVEVGRLRDKLDQPCGSCHPCINYGPSNKRNDSLMEALERTEAWGREGFEAIERVRYACGCAMQEADQPGPWGSYRDGRMALAVEILAAIDGHQEQEAANDAWATDRTDQ